MIHLYSVVLVIRVSVFFIFFFFNDTATTEIYTLSLHDALPISAARLRARAAPRRVHPRAEPAGLDTRRHACRSEEHTSELQSRLHLVCRLLLEKKKKNHKQKNNIHQYTVQITQ